MIFAPKPVPIHSAHVGQVYRVHYRWHAYFGADVKVFRTLNRGDGQHVFVPGLTDKALILQICEKVVLPVNVMMAADPENISDVAALAVSRISFGPSPYISLTAVSPSQG